MATGIDVHVQDVQLDNKTDTCVVRLPDGTAVEVQGSGWVFVYINDGEEFSHRVNLRTGVIKHGPH